MYPELLRKVVKNLRRFGKRSGEAEERVQARRWCTQISVDTRAAIEILTGNRDVESFYSRFAREVAKSTEAVARCPVRMGGRANLDLIYHLAEHVQAKRVVETGVAYGWSSLSFLLSLDKRDGACLVSTDMPYLLLRDAARYVGCAVPEELRRKWTLIRLADREALPRALRRLGWIDMCHYDSDKTYEGRMWAYRRLWEALRGGGIFLSDDVSDNLAFRSFCEEVGLRPVVVEARVGVLVKP